MSNWRRRRNQRNRNRGRGGIGEMSNGRRRNWRWRNRRRRRRSNQRRKSCRRIRNWRWLRNQRRRTTSLREIVAQCNKREGKRGGYATTNQLERGAAQQERGGAIVGLSCQIHSCLVSGDW